MTTTLSSQFPEPRRPTQSRNDRNDAALRNRFARAQESVQELDPVADAEDDTLPPFPGMELASSSHPLPTPEELVRDSQQCAEAPIPLPIPFLASPPLEESSFINPITSLPPVLQSCLEHLTEVMTVMNIEGLQETTVSLLSERWKGTPLEGLQIVIREYSTAPRAYNLLFVTPPAAQALLASRLDLLTQALAHYATSFRVQRCEVSLASDLEDREEPDSSLAHHAARAPRPVAKTRTL